MSQFKDYPLGTPTATDSFLYQEAGGAYKRVSTLGAPNYEEGTFTPVVEGATTAGVGTYITQIGYYTKFGDRVFITIYLHLSSHTGTGEIRIKGLPFPMNDISRPPVTLNISSLLLTKEQVFSFCLSDSIRIYQRDRSSGVGSVLIDQSMNLSLSTNYRI